jgi:hypothetical protein
MDGTTRKYVVLHHTGHGPSHYDLMFESMTGDSLVTYRVEHWPPVSTDAFIPLPNHRLAYLTYEGPVSRGRGEVRRVDEGACVVTATDRGWVVKIAGKQLELPKPSDSP